MQLSRSMRWTGCALGALLLGSLTGPAYGQGGGGGRGGNPEPMVNANQLRMPIEKSNPNGNTNVFGRQNAEGFYMYYNYFPPHQTSRPHFHDKDRWVLVVKGTWYTGEGDVFQHDKMIPMGPGSMMYHPAGMHHYDGSQDDKEVIVAIMGYGPVKTTGTEVDEKGNPVRGRGEGRGAEGRGGEE